MVIGCIAGGILCGSAVAQDIEITSISNGGRLTLAAPSGSVSTVEWTGNLSGAVDWRRDWTDQRYIVSTSGTTAVDIPMFFRITTWTNGLLAPMSSSGTSIWSVSNHLGETWTEETTVLGLFAMTSLSNEYVYASASRRNYTSRTYTRSTDREVFNLEIGDTNYTETVMNRIAEPGTVWTNYRLNWTERVAIIANETITVPAGTFDCIRHHTEILPPQTGEWTTWVSPGHGTVKWIYDPEGNFEDRQLHSKSE